MPDFPRFNGQTFKSADNFPPPKFGAVTTRYGQVVYSDNGTQKSLFTLPKGAEIINVVAEVKTVFNDSGTDLLKIGISSDDDYFATATSVAATGPMATTNYVRTDWYVAQAADVVVTATYNGQNSDMTTGDVWVRFDFVVRG